MSTDPFPFVGQVSPNGEFLYVGTRPGLSVYSINPTTGVLTAVGSTAIDTGSTTSIAINSTGQFLYSTPNALVAYDVNSSNGTLTAIPGAFYNILAGTVVLDLGGPYAYAVSAGGSTGVFGYTIDATGALVAMPGSPFPVPGDGFPFSVAVDPTGSFVYVGTFFSQGVTQSFVMSEYSINSSTGALTAVGSPVPTGDCEPASVNCGTQAIAVAPATQTVPGPAAISASPGSGSGASQMFAFKYSDGNGYTHLSVVYAGFGPTAYG